MPPPPTSHPQCSQAMYIGWHARPHHTTPRHGTPHLIARHGTTHHNTTWHEMPRHATPRHTTMHPSQTKVIQVQEKPTDLVEKLRPICHAAFKKCMDGNSASSDNMCMSTEWLSSVAAFNDAVVKWMEALPLVDHFPPRHATPHTTPHHTTNDTIPCHTTPHHTTPHHAIPHHITPCCYCDCCCCCCCN